LKEGSERRLNKLLSIIDTRILWIIAGGITLLLSFVLSYFPNFVEKYYSNGLFVGVRYVFDYTIGVLPFSLFYFLLMFIVGMFFYRIFLWFRLVFMMKAIPFKIKLKLTIISIFSFASKIIVAFYFLWGFNYSRISIEEKINIEVKELNNGEVLIEFNRLRKDAVELRSQIDFKKYSIPTIADIPEDLNIIVKKDLEDVMKDFGYKPVGNPPMRFIKPFGFLYSFGITGYYNPFLGEANMDKGFRPLYIPFLYAHELAHAYGFADEGTANFLAYMTCERSENKFVQYSGKIIYLQYLAHHVKNVKIKWHPFIFEDLIMNGFFKYDPKYDRMINLIIAYNKKRT
jgi:hypothetical protein